MGNPYDIADDDPEYLSLLKQYGVEPPQAPKPKGGFFGDVARGTGQVIGAFGTVAKDLGAERIGGAAESYGMGLARRHPSEVSTLADVIEKPGTTVRESLGEQVPQWGANIGAGVVLAEPLAIQVTQVLPATLATTGQQATEVLRHPVATAAALATVVLAAATFLNLTIPHLVAAALVAIQAAILVVLVFPDIMALVLLAAAVATAVREAAAQAAAVATQVLLLPTRTLAVGVAAVAAVDQPQALRATLAVLALQATQAQQATLVLEQPTATRVHQEILAVLVQTATRELQVTQAPPVLELPTATRVDQHPLTGRAKMEQLALQATQAQQATRVLEPRMVAQAATLQQTGLA
jgi:hypothetical protein